jgi:hypothetical protein
LQFLALKREVEVKDYLLVNVMTHCSTYVVELVVEEEHRLMPLLAGAEEEEVEEISWLISFALQKIVEAKAMVAAVEEQVVRSLVFVKTCLCCSRESLN